MRSRIIIASLVSLLVASFAAAPVTAAEPQRQHGAEQYAFKLVNCLRTGGKIDSTGHCKGWGTGKHSAKRPPLKLSTKISNKVSWPWAKRVAKLGSFCGHTYSGSTVDRRFKAAGFKATTNGENIGCASYEPKKMVRFILRWWQREQSYRGWHWRQLKDPDFKSVGVGVAKRPNGRAILVVNFYGKVIS